MSAFFRLTLLCISLPPLVCAARAIASCGVPRVEGFVEEAARNLLRLPARGVDTGLEETIARAFDVPMPNL